MEAFMEQKEKNETKRPEQEKEKNELQEMKDNQIKETGQLVLEENEKQKKIHLLSIIGEIEGHENLPNHSKTTKYEHVLDRKSVV